MVTTLVQLGRTAARPLGLVVQVGRRPLVRRVIGLVLVVAMVRAWAGVWAAALVGAVVVTVGLLAGWAAVERRMSDRVRARPPVVVVERGHRGPGRLDGEHVAFARGLAGLAAWYLAECEREAQR
ncbi:MAG TPA: hypothetical protein VK925_07675 [Jiangellaceae bacterium]|nr:hypothetical protein [Jiangellaceae bacterium]